MIGGAHEPARAATSSTVVGATVLSATSIDMSGCPPLASGTTDFGGILPSTSTTTTIDCAVAFGSSNATAQLRVRQTDGAGSAMWMPTRGALDFTLDGPSGTGDGVFVDDLDPAGESLSAVAVQPDGKIVAAGFCDAGRCLARYETDGSLDITFDGPSGTGNGHVLLPAADIDIVDVHVAPDGDIVLTGDCMRPWWALCAVRLLPDGQPDPAFDGPSGTGNGFVDHPNPLSFNDYALGSMVQTDGRVVIVGQCASGDYEMCAVRIRDDGTLDPTFDGPSGTGNGRIIVDFAPGSGAAADVLQARDGRIVLVGYCAGVINTDFCVARLDLDGALDASFDGPSGTADGAFTVPIGSETDWGSSIFERPDGSFVAGGSCMDGGGVIHTCLMAIQPNGAFVGSFDGPSGTGDGRVVVPLTPYEISSTSLWMDELGRVGFAGSCWDGVASMACVVRTQQDGTLDQALDGPSGSDDGIVTYTHPSCSTHAAVAARSDGRLVLVGTDDSGTGSCVRGLGTGGFIEDYKTGGGADRDWSSGPGTSMFGACLRAVSGGASAQWVPHAACAVTDGAHWNAVEPTTTTVAYTSALEPDPVDATAHLRFGIRAAGNQAAGAYVAPILFDVIAP